MSSNLEQGRVAEILRRPVPEGTKEIREAAGQEGRRRAAMPADEWKVS